MQIIALMTAWNEASWISCSIRSVIHHVDKLIVIEGAFAETVASSNVSLRSTDGTLEILEELIKQYDNLYLLQPDAPVSQLQQRQLIFQATSNIKEDFWLWIIDADEVYAPPDILKLKKILNETTAEVVKVNSLTFVNSLSEYVNIAFPRVFRIRASYEYMFMAPNMLANRRRDYRDGARWDLTFSCEEQNYEDEVCFYHMSYVKPQERFLQKKKEREKLGQKFKWYLNDKGKVAADGINLRKFEGELPIILKNYIEGKK